MALELTQTITPPRVISIERAILETLAYSDVFDYPLHADEVHRYLSVPITRDELVSALASHSDRIAARDGYFFLAGREAIVELRRHRATHSRPALRRAFRYGRVLATLPFIRMVALTGSLALLNCDDGADMDYLLVAAHGRVWTARAFALVFARYLQVGRFTALSDKTICPNLIVSERALAWRQHDLYSAREICQMLPIASIAIYTRLRELNSWTETYLPNASGAPHLSPSLPPVPPSSIAEWLLSGTVGDRLEAWEMNRKIKRFMRQAGYGPETIFTAEICQGNFEHHGLQTRRAFQRRLNELGLEPALPLEVETPRKSPALS